MNIYAIGVFSTFVLYILIGNYAGKKIKNSEDYYVAGRNAPTVLIVGTLVASFLSTVAFMGETGFSYDGYPILMLMVIALNITGYIIGGLYFGRYLRRSGCYTVPEFFGRRFDSKIVQSAAGWTTILGIGAYLVAVTQGASLLMSEMLGVGYGVSLLLVWLVYTSFTFYSGSKGVILTDTIMFFLFTLIAFIAGPYIIFKAGGWPEVIVKLAQFELKPDILAWHGKTGTGAYWPSRADAFIWAIVLGVVWSCVVAVSPWQASRYLMAKDENVTIRAALIVPASLALLYFLLQFSAAAINLIKPDIAPVERAYIWAAFNILPTWMGVLMLGGIMAAALSSCSTFLSLVGFSITRDILRKSDENARVLWLSRTVMAGVGGVILIITYYQPPGVMWIGYFAATLFAASWGPVAFMSIWSRRITAAGALWGIVGGFAAVVVCESLKKYFGWTLPVYLSAPVIGFFVSVACIFVGSMLSEVTESERTFLIKIRQLPGNEYDIVAVRRTLKLAKIVIGIGLLLSATVYIFYTVPFNKALL